MPVFGLPAIFEEGEKTIHDKPQMALGSCFGSNTDDTMLTYVKFSEAVAEGDVMRMKPNHYSKTNLSPATAGQSDFPVAGSQIITENDANYLTTLGNGDTGLLPEPNLRGYAKIAIIDGAGAGQRGYITHYTNKVLNIRWYDTDDGTLKTALDGTSDYVVYAPWFLDKAFADNAAARAGSVNGIVLAREAEANKYGLVGVRGSFPVRVQDPVVAGDVLVPSVIATKGRAARAGADDIPSTFATCQHNGASGSLVECTVYCEQISIVREIAESLIPGTPRPEAV